MKKLLVAIAIILTISFFSFAQDHNNAPLPGPQQPQSFAEVQHVYKVDGLSFDNKNWHKIDPPKTIEITPDNIITPDKVMHIAKELKAPTGDYIFTFTNDAMIYIFDFQKDLILVGTETQLGFILHIQRQKQIDSTIL